MTKKILIIEDETTLLAGIKLKLELAGYEVVVAQDGETGEQLIEKEKPDLILLDLVIPKKDGFQILEKLSREKTNIPVVIVSNSGQPVEIERALKLGAKDYLIKAHFVPSDILEKVESVFGAESASGDADSNKKIILVVEDDQFLRKVISQKLESEGFEVLGALDANRAFELINQRKPDLILLDLLLPGMHGFDVLKNLKENPETANIPIFVLSNLGENCDIEKAMALGAADYLLKTNFTPSEITQKIKKVIG